MLAFSAFSVLLYRRSLTLQSLTDGLFVLVMADNMADNMLIGGVMFSRHWIALTLLNRFRERNMELCSTVVTENSFGHNIFLLYEMC